MSKTIRGRDMIKKIVISTNLGLVVLLFGLFGGYLLADQVSPKPYGSENSAFNRLPGTVVTPHISWAKPYYQGRIKVLVFAPTWSQRETVELAQRLDIDYAPIMSSSFDEMIDTKTPQQSVSPAIVEQATRERLKENYDVIIIGKQSWASIPKEFQYEILKKVRNDGAGLVYICPKNYQEIDAVFQKKKVEDTQAFIATGIPLTILPVLKSIPLGQLVSLSEFGKGRVVKVDYNQAESMPWLSLTPVTTENWPLAYDYYHAFLAKAVIWAAQKEPEIYIQKIEVVNQPASALRIVLSNISQQKEAVEVEMKVRDNESIVEQEKKLDISLERGEKELKLNLSALKDGLHLIDLWVKKEGKIINFGSTFIEVDAKYKVEKIVLDKEGYNSGDVVGGKVIFNQAVSGKNLNLRIQLWDNFGRLLDEKVVKPNGQEAPFSFKIAEALSMLLKVKVSLLEEKQILSELARDFPVAAQRGGERDYRFIMWGGVSPGDYLLDPLRRQFTSLGVDADFSQPDAKLAWSAARANQQVVPYLFGTFSASRAVEADNVRKPCLNDPEYRQSLKNTIDKLTPLYKSLGIPAYNLTINGGLSYASPEQELCFCPLCTKGFQDYVKKEYQTLSDLNKEWDTNYSSWEEIKPITLPEAREKGQYAHWADFRLYMEEVFTGLNLFCKNEIQKIDPAAIVGFNEPLEATSFRGISWWKLLNGLDMCGVYINLGGRYTEVPKEIVRSFLKNGRKGTITGGWVGSYGFHSEEFNRAMPWRVLFHDGDSLWDWAGYATGGNGGDWTALTADLAPLPYFVQLTGEIREVKQGIGKLLLNGKREDDGIAIHFSPLSTHASTIDAGKGDVVDSQQSFIYVLEDIGLQYNFIANEEIEKGELEKRGYKVLILPYAQALSAIESGKIKDFVQHGGTVIADYNPGVMDNHCKRLNASSLTEVFGGFQTGLKKNSYGKGQAFCLDNLLKEYLNLRKVGQEEKIKERMQAILESAGVRPRLKITTASGKDLAANETTFFKNGEIEYVCLFKNYDVEDQSAQKITIKFPYKAHLYNLRENKYYGYVDEVQTEIIPAEAKVFALAPAQVEGVNLSLKQHKFKPGEILSYTVTLKEAKGDASPHVFRLELSDPDGQKVTWYSRNLLAKEARYSGTTRLSLNEKKGKWEISIKDVMSGKTAKEEFNIE